MPRSVRHLRRRSFVTSLSSSGLRIARLSKPPRHAGCQGSFAPVIALRSSGYFRLNHTPEVTLQTHATDPCKPPQKYSARLTMWMPRGEPAFASRCLIIPESTSNLAMWRLTPHLNCPTKITGVTDVARALLRRPAHPGLAMMLTVLSSLHGR